MPRDWHVWLLQGAGAALRILLLLALFFVARAVALRAIHRVMRPLLARSAERDPEGGVSRLRTLEALSRSAVTYVLVLLVVILTLDQLGIKVGALLAGAGVAGLALSFGAQRLVRDVLTGFFLLFDDQFRVGETVTLVGVPGLAQVTGTVLEMGLRTTRLEDVSGKLLTVANGDIAAVVNHCRGPITATVELGIPPETPLSRLREVVSGMALPEALFAGPAQVQGVTALEASRIVVRIAAPARPGRAPDAELALRQTLGESLRQAEIEIR